jgi:hypothetical protein
MPPIRNPALAIEVAREKALEIRSLWWFAGKEEKW